MMLVSILVALRFGDGRGGGGSGSLTGLWSNEGPGGEPGLSD